MEAWDTIRATIASEFSDLNDLEEATRVVLRMVMAVALGALVGLQRERQQKAAGIRTHMLVAGSAALIVLIPLQVGLQDEGISRVLQGLLAGIGFLCAGVILKLPNEENVRGLTTAASVWMCSAIGMAAGMGREMTAVFATVLVLFVLWLEGPLVRLGLRQEGKED